jgi:hypothetical protein
MIPVALAAVSLGTPWDIMRPNPLALPRAMPRPEAFLGHLGVQDALRTGLRHRRRGIVPSPVLCNISLQYPKEA